MKQILTGNWHILKGKIKETWGKLTDDDITTIEGDFENIYGVLQKHYGYSKEQVNKRMEELIDKYKE